MISVLKYIISSADYSSKTEIEILKKSNSNRRNGKIVTVSILFIIESLNVDKLMRLYLAPFLYSLVPMICSAERILNKNTGFIHIPDGVRSKLRATQYLERYEFHFRVIFAGTTRYDMVIYSCCPDDLFSTTS